LAEIYKPLNSRWHWYVYRTPSIVAAARFGHLMFSLLQVLQDSWAFQTSVG
jgi:hypothetical protein